MKLKVKIPLPAWFVYERLADAGFEVYFVGGAVRDLLLKEAMITDWDITTDATPGQILPLFQGSFYDNNFGTVMLPVEHVLEQAVGEEEARKLSSEFDDLKVFDVTTFRTEESYSDKRRPDQVRWGESLEEDVCRRDFTINALAMKAMDDGQGTNERKSLVEAEVQVIDYFGGREDLEAGLVRAVGEADERFSEDALRMLRAVRLASELGFQIEERTKDAIKEKSALINRVSSERIRDELMRILGSKWPAEGVELMDEAGLLREVLPELVEMKGVPQGGHHIYDVWKHSIESLRECPSNESLVRLATLLHDVGKPATMKKQGPRGVTFYGHEVVGARMAKAIADRLRLSKKDRKKLWTLVRWHMFHYDPKMTDAAIRRFIRRVGVENINDMMMLRIGDRKGGGSKATSWRLREMQRRIGENLYEPMKVADLVIGGNDVMKTLGLKPSKPVGLVLNQLFEEVVEGKLKNEKEALIGRTKEMWGELKADGAF